MQAFAWLTIVLAEAPAATTESSGLGINAAFLISQMISFAIVFLILWRWGFPAIMKTLEERQRKIRQGIEDADKAKQDLENATQRAEKILADARIQAQETIDRASKAAQQQANQTVEEAQARAEQVSQQQIARIQQEASRARAELSRLVVNLSIDAASKVISRSVDSRDNRQLVEEFVSASDQARNN